MEAPAKIIVVDDEKQICQNVAKILSKSNYEVTHALNAQEALEIMATESFSLLISDIVMPGKNGLELYHYIRTIPKLSQVPFIIMSTFQERDIVVEAIKAGIRHYLKKPLEKDELHKTIAALSDAKNN